MEVCGAVVSLEDGDCAARLQQLFQQTECVDRTREMLQNEADEDVFEGLGLERQRVEIGVDELDIDDSGRGGPGGRLLQRLDRTVKGDKTGARAVERKTDSLRSGAAADFEDATAGRIPRV